MLLQDETQTLKLKVLELLEENRLLHEEVKRSAIGDILECGIEVPGVSHCRNMPVPGVSHYRSVPGLSHCRNKSAILLSNGIMHDLCSNNALVLGGEKRNDY